MQTCSTFFFFVFQSRKSTFVFPRISFVAPFGEIVRATVPRFFPGLAVQEHLIPQALRGHGFHQLDVCRGSSTSLSYRRVRLPTGRAFQALLRRGLG